MSEEETEPHQCQKQFRQEREARSLALEKAYVHDVYAQIAPHFVKHRSKAWPRVCQFLVDLEPGSLVCDVGCGNGKYLSVNPEVFNLGSDRCSQLADIARLKQHELVVCDNLHAPFRDESFDAALSVAVIHHLATTERRVQALRELARILRLGGRLMISVWAMEQRHRRFESQDVLVPWHKPVESSGEDQASHNEGEVTSTTTSDDDLLNYHAHSQLDSDSCSLPSRYGRRRHRIRSNRGYCRNFAIDGPCGSSSQSSSDLSSPNETCYSFVRRALQKFSNSKSSWDNPGRKCRPWFVPSPPLSQSQWHAPVVMQDSAEGTENPADLPIELRDVDAPSSELELPPKKSSPLHLNHKSKSKSLGDLLGHLTAVLLRNRKQSSDKTLGRSKSTHTHLTRVDEVLSVPENVEKCRRPQSLIMLNAEDKRNGNTILPDIEYQPNKRASWPVVPKKVSLRESQRDSGIELSNGETKPRKFKLKIPQFKRPLIRIESFNADDIAFEAMVNKMVSRAKLFHSHSMPDLHIRLLGNKSQRCFSLTKAVIRNGFKGCNKLRQKESLLRNGFCLIKRSLSLDNYDQRNIFEPRERIYCNRITKEDSLQRDTSYDSDDSVASVIAVAPREPGTTSDTSVDSEDSCISVIAMPNKPINDRRPDVLQATNVIPSVAITPDIVSAASPTSDHSPNAVSRLPDVVQDEKVRKQIPSLSRCSSEGADDDRSPTCERKTLRKAGSLPEQSEPRQNSSEKHLLTQPAVALSVSADMALGKGCCERLTSKWQTSAGDSFSSSRSSSNSSISWEKFLDKSRCVVLDNIAVVSAGSEMVIRGKGSVAIVKNASERSPVLNQRKRKGLTDTEVEFKEASVQTSLTLYSSETVNSPRHEDRLNGNLPPTQTNTPVESLTNHHTHTSKEELDGPEDNYKCLNRQRSLSTSDESLQCADEVGGLLTLHRYYHVFREGELDQLIEKYVENLHIISSYYDHANWCIIAEKVQVWRI